MSDDQRTIACDCEDPWCRICFPVVSDANARWIAEREYFTQTNPEWFDKDPSDG